MIFPKIIMGSPIKQNSSTNNNDVLMKHQMEKRKMSPEHENVYWWLGCR